MTAYYEFLTTTKFDQILSKCYNLLNTEIHVPSVQGSRQSFIKRRQRVLFHRSILHPACCLLRVYLAPFSVVFFFFD